MHIKILIVMLGRSREQVPTESLPRQALMKSRGWMALRAATFSNACARRLCSRGVALRSKRAVARWPPYRNRIERLCSWRFVLPLSQPCSPAFRSCTMGPWSGNTRHTIRRPSSRETGVVLASSAPPPGVQVAVSGRDEEVASASRRQHHHVASRLRVPNGLLRRL